MSTDEIRRLAGEQPGDMTATDVNCIDISDEVRAALLAYAAMVERCERRLKQLRDYRDEDLINEVNYILKGVTDETKH